MNSGPVNRGSCCAGAGDSDSVLSKHPAGLARSVASHLKPVLPNGQAAAVQADRNSAALLSWGGHGACSPRAGRRAFDGAGDRGWLLATNRNSSGYVWLTMCQVLF